MKVTMCDGPSCDNFIPDVDDETANWFGLTWGIGRGRTQTFELCSQRCATGKVLELETLNREIVRQAATDGAQNETCQPPASS